MARGDLLQPGEVELGRLHRPSTAAAGVGRGRTMVMTFGAATASGF
uniref:Uncharacterized protein n=1 Tax=Arundo donax TaxID=35708 RepID=A0A0A9AM91_ARUDO